MMISWRDPWETGDPFARNQYGHASLKRNAQRIGARQLGTMSGSRRYMAGDPSWLSQFMRHNSGLAKKLVGTATSAVTGLFLGPQAGEIAGRLVSSRVGMSSGGSTKVATAMSQNPMPMMQYRPTGTSGMGKAAGMTAGLAPLPPNWNRQMIHDAWPGSFAGPIDEAGPTEDPGTQVTAVPSSGGGSMLWHHFFGKSNSKAIPVSQTNGMRPSGYHVNKHGYYLSSIATWLPPGTVWVKGRRRNPLNPRALHRSIARLVSAKHAVKKLHILDVPRRPRKAQRAFGRIPSSRRLKAG
jgi:hypothetical protein